MIGPSWRAGKGNSSDSARRSQKDSATGAKLGKSRDAFATHGVNHVISGLWNKTKASDSCPRCASQKLTCFTFFFFFPFCPLCSPRLLLLFSRHIFAHLPPSKSALFGRAKGTTQSLERGSSVMDLSTKFGKELAAWKTVRKITFAMRCVFTTICALTTESTAMQPTMRASLRMRCPDVVNLGQGHCCTYPAIGVQSRLGHVALLCGHSLLRCFFPVTPISRYLGRQLIAPCCLPVLVLDRRISNHWHALVGIWSMLDPYLRYVLLRSLMQSVNLPVHKTRRKTLSLHLSP